MQATFFGAVVFLVLMAGLFVPLEAWRPAVPLAVRPRTVAACAGLFFLNTLLMQTLGAPLLAGLASLGEVVDAPSPLRLALVFVLADVCGYFIHRTMHRVPGLWRFHALHHASRELSWPEAWRQHPVDFLLHGVAVGVPGALLGATLSDITAVVLLRKAWTTFLHANVDVRFGALAWLVASPAYHRLHHGVLPAHHDRNFAGTFPWLDLAFGTALAPPPGLVAVGLEAANAGPPPRQPSRRSAAGEPVELDLATHRAASLDRGAG